tara:strand:+ start:2214 stop:2639 length:426 start_codon:yes stop_codon:yes gene_type:complete
MSKKYQQGDVLLIEIEDDDKFDKFAKPNHWSMHEKNNGDGGNVVLAFGEVTGHSHQFKPEDMAGVPVLKSYHTKSRVYENGTYSDKERIDDEAKAIQILADDGMTLYHEEHAPLTVPPGNYEVKIVREFDHMTQRVTRVWD